MRTRRINKWQTALDELVAARSKAPFAWGANDCCLFAADAVLAITGRDPAADLRGTYGDINSGTAMMQRLGGVAAIAAARAGAEITPGLLQIGDIALVQSEGRDTLSVCVGGHLVAPAADGLAYIPRALALRGWRCTKEH